MDVGMDFTPECTPAGMWIDVLQDHDSRPRNSQKMVPPIGSVQKFRRGTRDRQHIGSNTPRDGISHDCRTPRKHAADAGIGKTFVAQTDLEFLDRIRYGASAQILKLLQDVRRYRFHPA